MASIRHSGILVGVGLGPLYVSVMSTLMKWYVEKRSLAVGIVTSGIGIGQLVMASALAYLIGVYGCRVAFVVMGTITMSILLTAASIVRRSPEGVGLVPYGVEKDTLVQLSPIGSERTISLKEASRTGVFWMLYLYFMLASFALFIVMVHMVPCATDVGIDLTSASFALGLIGAIGMVGKLVMGAVPDRIGRPYTFILCSLGEALTIPTLLYASSAWTPTCFQHFSDSFTVAG